jgi:hypothetical protein
MERRAWGTTSWVCRSHSLRPTTDRHVNAPTAGTATAFRCHAATCRRIGIAGICQIAAVAHWTVGPVETLHAPDEDLQVQPCGYDQPIGSLPTPDTLLRPKNPTLKMIATAIIGVATATGNCLSSGQDMSHCQNMSRIVSDPL